MGGLTNILRRMRWTYLNGGTVLVVSGLELQTSAFLVRRSFVVRGQHRIPPDVGKAEGLNAHRVQVSPGKLPRVDICLDRFWGSWPK